MHKLMIVEDEPLIRAGLMHYFPWEELGVGVILEAENGKEGMLLALQEKPDLIITDIRMPEMDGLDMIEQLRPALPNTLFIILTGYNEFQYALRAIQIGNVKNFLLKPLEYDESIQTLKDCLKQLEHNQRERQSRLVLETAMRENTELKYDSVVRHLLEGAHLESPELQPFRELSLLSYSYIPVVATYLDSARPCHNSHRNGRAALQALANRASAALIKQFNNSRIMTYYRNAKLYALIAIEPAEDNLKKLANIWTNAAAVSSGRIYLSVGETAHQLSTCESTLKAAEKALYQRYFHPGQTLFLFKPTPERFGSIVVPASDRTIQLQNDDRHALLACLKEGSVVKTKQLMERLKKESLTLSSTDSIDPWLAFLQEMISVTLGFAHRNGITVEGVYSDKLLTLAFTDEFATANELFDWLADWVIQLNVAYNKQGQRSTAGDTLIFEQIEHYIKQHIDEDVTLQMVADRFFYNPSYLSRLFKTKLNKNYMSFVTEIRIQAAQQFLRNPRYLVTDVCTMCGYKSYKHFVKTFRGISGMTPTDYRKGIGL